MRDRPIWAPPNFRSLPTALRLDNGNEDASSWCIWVGSGFRIRELPIWGLSAYAHDEAMTCGACKGTDVLCIYLHNCGDQSGTDHDAEVICRTCGKFTCWNGFA